MGGMPTLPSADHIVALERPLIGFSRFYQMHLVSGGRWDKNPFLGRLWWRINPLCSKFPSLFKIVIVKNLTIFLGALIPFLGT